ASFWPSRSTAPSPSCAASRTPTRRRSQRTSPPRDGSHMGSTILDSVLELLAPLGCAACDAPSEGALFCGPCEATVLMCDRALGLYEYGGAVAEAVKRLKYQGRTDLGARLGDELA